MKAIALFLTILIGFIAAASYDQEEWEALTEKEQIEIINELAIEYSRRHGTRDIEVFIEREGGKVKILLRSRIEEA